MTGDKTAGRARIFAAAYAAPTIPESIASVAVVAVIPGYYASELGIPAAMVGWALLSSRSIDAIFDPVIGFFSDATRTRQFGRKPLVLFGAVVMALGAFKLFAPPALGVDAAYLALWSLVFYSGWTIFAVPYESWGAELSSDSGERTRIFAWRAGFFYLGMTAFFLAPYLPGRASTAIDAEALWINAILIAVLAPGLTVLAMIYAPAGPQPAEDGRGSLADALRSLRANAPLKLYLVNALVSGLGNGMNVSLAYFFVADYLRLSEHFSLILICNIMANLVALPVWQIAIHRLGKKNSWALGLLLNALTMPAFLLVPPGSEGFWPALTVASLSGATYSVCNVVLPAILGDVVDYETLRSRQVRTGGIFALYALVRKFNNAIGSGLAFLVVAAFGYEAGILKPGMATFGLMFAFVWVPTLLQAVTAYMAWTFPIDEHRHAIIVRRLKRRRASETMVPKSTTEVEHVAKS